MSETDFIERVMEDEMGEEKRETETMDGLQMGYPWLLSADHLFKVTLRGTVRHKAGAGCRK